MQVFSLFMKLLNANKKSFFIYIGIFSGLLFGIIIPNQAKNQSGSFVASRTDFAVIDQDHSAASAGITEYLTETQNLETLPATDENTIQDQLFYRELDAVLIFKEGFEGALLKGETTNEYVEIMVIPDTMDASLFEQSFNSYVSKLAMYLQSGFSMEESLAKTTQVSQMEMEVQYFDNSSQNSHSNSYYFFIYLAWIFLAVCIQSVSPVLGIMNRDEVKNRVYFSSYKFSEYNLETLFGAIVTGVGMCLFFLVIASFVFPGEIFTLKGVLWMVNMLSFMVVAMAFTFLISKLTTNAQVIAVASNIISLGMAFTCGVFVPMELLSENVIRIAHFLPAYWYVEAVNMISTYQPAKLGMIFAYMGIELLFGGAVIAMAFVAAKKK